MTSSVTTTWIVYKSIFDIEQHTLNCHFYPDDRLSEYLHESSNCYVLTSFQIEDPFDEIVNRVFTGNTHLHRVIQKVVNRWYDVSRENMSTQRRTICGCQECKRWLQLKEQLRSQEGAPPSIDVFRGIKIDRYRSYETYLPPLRRREKSRKNFSIQ